MPSPFQGSRYALPKSRVQPCNAPAGMRSGLGHGAGAVAGGAVALVGDCPMCGKVPLEPVRLEGQYVCHGCASACTVCGDPCIPGDDVCGECGRGLGLGVSA